MQQTLQHYHTLTKDDAGKLVIPDGPMVCPNCGEPWCSLERAAKECFECGYPNLENVKTDEDTED